VLTRKEFEAHTTLPTAIDAISFDFSESKSKEDRMIELATWLNKVIKKGAVDFHQNIDGDSVILIAFSDKVPDESLNKIKDINWDKYFSND